ncbi:thioredoxin-like protein [Syncephalis pseudoplumigaleata]|uniref:Thioredoxin-like protein n=1 Tax=Syncephalis pseudoplumigaleata TaxID=1712513 RepID=A0A4P9Z7K4_9FUNG|nr:thioredoxin-like protein [Syncephalis pseudoplumigaleata]|eukprot:RKP27891.1 thioredoxin-like protein [Syncephalis pseudoplumigaleata]
MTLVKQLVQRAIHGNKVVIFSKTWCPYCHRAKAILQEAREPALAIELNKEERGADIQAYLAHTTGQSTVPNIFIGGKHVGGCSDLEDLESSGQLQALLANAKAGNNGSSSQQQQQQ